MKPLTVGDRAPEVSAVAHDGRRVALSEFFGRGAVVLFFYPTDGTSVCTKEVCAFRDAYEDFVQAGAVVLGVSSDGEESHRRFAERQHNQPPGAALQLMVIMRHRPRMRIAPRDHTPVLQASHQPGGVHDMAQIRAISPASSAGK